MVDNFSSYVGDKILLLGNEDKRVVAAILKKNFTTDLLVRNIYIWEHSIPRVAGKKCLSIAKMTGIKHGKQIW